MPSGFLTGVIYPLGFPDNSSVILYSGFESPLVAAALASCNLPSIQWALSSLHDFLTSLSFDLLYIVFVCK